MYVGEIIILFVRCVDLMLVNKCTTHRNAPYIKFYSNNTVANLKYRAKKSNKFKKVLKTNFKFEKNI